VDAQQPGASNLIDYWTDGADIERSGWIKNEKILTKANVGTLKLKWKLETGNQPRALHALMPVLVIGQLATPAGTKQVGIVNGISDNLYAFDVETGKILWQKHWDYAPEPGGGGRGGAPQNVPAEYQPMQGAYTAAQTGPQVRKFLEAGGTVLAVGRSSMNLAQLMQLPVSSHLSEKSPDGTTRAIPQEKYYVPGSVLRVTVDTSAPIAHGITNPVDVFFDNSPVFKLAPDASLKGVRPVAWFDSATPLRSGWAYGQGYLEGGVQVVDASVGAGKLYMFGPEITFRAQPHGTFKFLFNGIYLASRKPAAPISTASR
jgi:hypothetical protein